MCLGVPGRIETITGGDQMSLTGKVSFGGILKEVSLAYVPEAKIGDYVVVHVGFAISRLDEQEAHRVLGFLKEIADMNEELNPSG